MSSAPQVLDIALYGRCIGTLTLLPGDQTLFVFEQAYVDDHKRPTLSLSFKDVIQAFTEGFFVFFMAWSCTSL